MMMNKNYQARTIELAAKRHEIAEDLRSALAQASDAQRRANADATEATADLARAEAETTAALEKALAEDVASGLAALEGFADAPRKTALAVQKTWAALNARASEELGEGILTGHLLIAIAKVHGLEARMAGQSALSYAHSNEILSAVEAASVAMLRGDAGPSVEAALRRAEEIICSHAHKFPSRPARLAAFSVAATHQGVYAALSTIDAAEANADALRGQLENERFAARRKLDLVAADHVAAAAAAKRAGQDLNTWISGARSVLEFTGGVTTSEDF